MQQKFVNIHIPKTAGSSFRANLAWSLNHAHGERHQLIGVDAPIAGMSYFEGLQAAAHKRVSELLEPGMQVMSGHFRYRDITPVIAPMRNRVSLVAFIRDPITRTISDYLYSTSERHPGHQEFIQHYPTLEAYSKNSGEMNKQVDYFRPFDGASDELTIDNALKNIDFIGLTEMFDQDFAILMGQCGLEYDLQPPENINPDRSAMTEALERYSDLLESVLQPDIALYDAVKSHRGLS